MIIEIIPRAECLHNLPDQWILCRCDLKGQAAWLGAGKPGMLGDMRLHGRSFFCRDANQMTPKPDHSSSIVPGGFEVMS